MRRINILSLFAILLTVVFLSGCASDSAKKPKYVFLFIGDGMSLPQRMVAEEFSRITGRGKLAINTLPNHATTRTSSANATITDSAASATAIACGEKTNNGMIGLAPDGRKLQSVAEYAHGRSKKIGIITTVNINHATPSGFYGHRKSRNMYFELGCDLVASNFEFFGGGGILKYENNGKNIFDMAVANGYTVATGKNGIRDLKPGQKAILLADSKSNAMPYSINAGKDIPTLADITGKAIEMLDNPAGFFIMVEGGAIDYAGHANEIAANVYDTLAFDDAVKVALKFYEAHPEETLIIVTGDHETGAMTLGFAGHGYNLNFSLLAHQKCSIGAFQNILAAAKKANAKFDFEDAKKLMSEYFGFKFDGDKKDPLFIKPAELEKLKKAFDSGKLPNAVKGIVNDKIGIHWSSGGHTALPVLTTSIGCQSELFTGFIENSDISIKLKSIL